MNPATIISTWARRAPRISGAGCGESRTSGSKWEVRDVTVPIDPTIVHAPTYRSSIGFQLER
jgi:hypothetical protein